jgi:hypothetical protein
MIHIEIRSLGFALFAAPFGWYDIVRDVKQGPSFRVRMGRVHLGNWHHG